MIKKILVAQPTSVGSNPQYVNLCAKYSVIMTFTQFFHIEPVSVRQFRGQGISIPDYTAIVFSSRATIDAFFSICKELKIKMPDEQKYFCTTEAVALYLQKHIVYRKRKIFFGDGSFRAIVKLASLEKHRNENFLLVTPDQQNPELLRLFTEAGLKYQTAIMARFVGVNIKHLDLNDYQVICCYNSADVKSLLENFPKFNQGNIKLIAFGNGTRKAMKENGLKITIEGPTKEIPSLTSALDTLLKNPDYKQTVFPAEAPPIEIPKSTSKSAKSLKSLKTEEKKPLSKINKKVKEVLKSVVAAVVESTVKEKGVAKKAATKGAVKPTAKKAVAKKSVAKKSTAKKVAKSIAKRVVTKKTAVKKVAKPIAKKATKVKVATKKVAVKKVVKPTAKKVVAKKAVVKKSTKPSVKKVAKPIAKKVAKTTTKKGAKAAIKVKKSASKKR